MRPRELAGLYASNAHEVALGWALLAVALAYFAAGVLVERRIARRRLARPLRPAPRPAAWPALYWHERPDAAGARPDCACSQCCQGCAR